MNRLILAALLVVLGVTMFGIATGLVYLDMREQALKEPQPVQTQAPAAPSRAQPAKPDSDDTSPRRLVWAMGVGPLGAGLALAGGLVGLIELVAVFRRPRTTTV